MKRKTGGKKAKLKNKTTLEEKKKGGKQEEDADRQKVYKMQ